METSSVKGGQLAAHIRAHLPELRDAEARVAQVVLDQGADLANLTIGDVAALAGTAASSVVRACQRLGFRGFQQLKLAAAQQAPRQTADQDPASQDPAARALTDTLRAAREALDGLTATLDAPRLRAAAELLDTASRVLVVGAGLSGVVALDAAYRLRALGSAVDSPADPSTAQLAAGLLSPGAVCFAISHTGAARSTVDAARLAKEAGATVIALTSTAQSPLTKLSDCTLVAGGQDLILGLETVASRLAHLAVIDALSLTLLTLRGAAAEQALFLSAGITADHLY